MGIFNLSPSVDLMDGRQYMLDSISVYSLRDLVDAVSGSLLPFLYYVMEKFIVHVSKTCEVCRIRGLYSPLFSHEHSQMQIKTEIGLIFFYTYTQVHYQVRHLLI